MAVSAIYKRALAMLAAEGRLTSAVVVAGVVLAFV